MTEWLLPVTIALITGGVGLALITWLRQRGREPIEQDSIIVAAAYKALESFQISHAVLQKDNAMYAARNAEAIAELRSELENERQTRLTTVNALRDELSVERDARLRETASLRKMLRAAQAFVERLRRQVSDAGLVVPEYPAGYWPDDNQEDDAE